MFVVPRITEDLCAIEVYYYHHGLSLFKTYIILTTGYTSPQFKMFICHSCGYLD